MVQGAVNTGPALPGPFLVVALDMGFGPGGSSGGAELTILTAPRRQVFADVDLMVIEGVRFMRQFPEGRKAGTLEIGDPLFIGGSPYLWPWYVYEGAVGYLALWVSGEFGVDATVAVTVWELEEFRPAGAAPARDPYADAAARWESWRRLVTRELRERISGVGVR